MNEFSGLQIAGKRKEMGLSQRKAASLIEKLYGVKISHSYLSLIERGRICSVGGDLKNALKDFFKLRLDEIPLPPPYGRDLPEMSGENNISVHRIPLYQNRKVDSYLDITGPVLADFAVAMPFDSPEIGVFREDILVCRKEKPTEGDLAVTRNAGGFAYIFYNGRETPDIEGTVVLILKKSVSAKHHEAAVNAAAYQLDEDLLVGELARRNGLRHVDLTRSLAVLKEFSRDREQERQENEKNNRYKPKKPQG